MKKTRTTEIMNRMTAFANDKYTKDEMANELFKLQNEMAAIAFGEALTEGKWFFDILDHYVGLNGEQNKVTDEQIDTFRKECIAATNSLRGLASGQKGEKKTMYKLRTLRSDYRIEKNIELGNDETKTEIDALVVTEKAAFIIEVKNTKRDIFIDENGQYYRTGEFLKWDSDLGYKLTLREEYVRAAAERAGFSDLKIEKIVVFTDSRISVQNKCKSFRTCFLNQLTSLIDNYSGEKMIMLQQAELLLEGLRKEVTITRYDPEFDVQKFKSDFAEIVATLDYPEKPEIATKVVWWKNLRALVSALTLRRAA